MSSNRPGKKSPVEIDEGFDEFLLGEDFQSTFHVSQYIDDAHSHSLAYIASMIESKIIWSKPPRMLIKCEECTAVFVENELIEDSFIRFKARCSNITQPCRSTFEICKFVDTFLKSCEQQTASYQSIVLHILRNIPYYNLYISSDFSNHSGDKGHKYEFVKKIVEIYMRMKSTYIAKSFTLNTHENPIRHSFRKLIQQQGQ